MSIMRKGGPYETGKSISAGASAMPHAASAPRKANVTAPAGKIAAIRVSRSHRRR